MISFMLIAEFGPFLCFLLLVVKIGMTTSERSPVLSWRQACSSSNCHTDPSTGFKSWLFLVFIPFSSFSKHNQASWTRSWATNKAIVRLKALRPLNESTKCQYLKHLTCCRGPAMIHWEAVGWPAVTSAKPKWFLKHGSDCAGVTTMSFPGVKLWFVFEAHHFGPVALYLQQQLLKIKKITLKAWLALLTRPSYVKV